MPFSLTSQGWFKVGKYKFKGGLEVICPICGSEGRYLGSKRLVCIHLVEVSLDKYRIIEVGEELYLVAPQINVDLAMQELPLLDGGPQFRTTSIIKLRSRPHFPWRSTYYPGQASGLEIA
jgi:hypothetical protein